MINDVPVEFTLQGEMKLADVVRSVSAWSRERDLVFYEVYVDGTVWPVDRVPDVTLADIEALNCIVQSRADVVIAAVDEGGRYCDRVNAFIDAVAGGRTPERADLDDLAGGLDWLAEVLGVALRELGLDPERFKTRDRTAARCLEDLAGLKQAVAGAGDAAAAIPARRELFDALKELFRAILLSGELKALVMSGIDSPDMLVGSLAGLRDEAPQLLRDLDEIVVAYQTGKDARGSEKLNVVLDYLYRFSRTCFQSAPVFGIDLSTIVVDDRSLEDVVAALKAHLQQIMEVLEAGDIISLCDILEYEMKPALMNLEQYLDQVIGSMGITQE